MLRKRKWIKGLAADDPLSRAAELALRERLPLVGHYLPLAARRYSDDVEYVHQLRVATRRAFAAIDVFADTLPKRRAAWISRRLRRLRRAAGEARDVDVLIEQLAQDRNGYEAVIDEISLRRIRAQGPIVDAYEKLKAEDFSQRSEQLLERVRWRGGGPEPSFAQAARRSLKLLAKKFIRQTKADLSDMNQLHRLRKDGKRLRYAMEFFVDAYDQRFRSDVYVQVKKIQEKLGKINDHHAAQEYFRRWSDSEGGGASESSLADLATDQRDAMLIEADAFRDWFDRKRSKQLEKALAKLC